MNKTTILKMILGAAGAVLTIASQALGDGEKKTEAKTEKNKA